MSGVAAKLQHNRDKSQGIGKNSNAVAYLNQNYKSLKQSCLQRRRLFEDESFEPLPASLGFNELGPSSYKVRGIKWLRPKVGTAVLTQTFACRFAAFLGFTVCVFKGDTAAMI